MDRIVAVAAPVLLFLMFTGEANAADRGDGLTLKQDCDLAVRLVDHKLTTEEDSIEGTYDVLRRSNLCTGMMRGIAAAIRYDKLLGGTGISTKICLPDEVMPYQMAAVTLAYLEDHPENLHFSRWSLSIAALRTGFPCE